MIRIDRFYRRHYDKWARRYCAKHGHSLDPNGYIVDGVAQLRSCARCRTMTFVPVDQ